MILVAFLVWHGSLGDTPEKTFAELKKAVSAKDMGALYDLQAPSDRREAEEELKKLKEEAGTGKGQEELKELARTLGVTVEAILKMSPRDLDVKRSALMSASEKDGVERDFGKYKNGVIADRKIDGELCVLRIKVGDREQEAEFVREDGKWYLSKGPEKRARNERTAAGGLSWMVKAEGAFRANDQDGDGLLNFWVKDVAGLHGLDIGGRCLDLVPVEIARADRTEGRGKYPAIKEEAPSSGYHYAAMKSYLEGGKPRLYDEGNGRNEKRFGFVAWPARYPQQGRLTLIVNQDGRRILAKDNGGKPVEEFPEDPIKAGWRILE